MREMEIDMKYLHRFPVWLGCLGWLGLMSMSSPSLAHPDPAGISTLAWLAGSWGATADGIASEEHWTGTEGDGLVGMHKDVKAGKMVGFEFLRIEEDAEQRVCFVSMPGGAPPTSFCAIELGEKRVVFENRQHDFPQRILYWLEGEKLHARIEGPLHGQEVTEEWVWSRAAP